jgi:hypothetical protein
LHAQHRTLCIGSEGEEKDDNVNQIIDSFDVEARPDMHMDVEIK